MEDDEAVVEGVVTLDAGGDLGPAGGGDGGGVEEDGEFVEGVADVAGVLGDWGSEGWAVLGGFVIDDYW